MDEVSKLLDGLYGEKQGSYTHLENYWRDVRGGMRSYERSRITARTLHRQMSEPAEPSTHVLGHVLSGMEYLGMIALVEEHCGRPNVYSVEPYVHETFLDTGIALECRKHQHKYG